MENVQDIAKWFLNKESMTHKKLQKLCYFAQAWSCAFDARPLFPDTIEAWIHGPVIPNLYRQYKNYGYHKIPQNAFDSSVFYYGQDTVDTLNFVWDTYGKYSENVLEYFTHHDAPWMIARGNLRPEESSHNEISLDSMATFYSEMYEEASREEENTEKTK